MEVSVRPLTKDVVEDDGQLMAIFAKEVNLCFVTAILLWAKIWLGTTR